MLTNNQENNISIDLLTSGLILDKVILDDGVEPSLFKDSSIAIVEIADRAKDIELVFQEVSFDHKSTTGKDGGLNLNGTLVKGQTEHKIAGFDMFKTKGAILSEGYKIFIDENWHYDSALATLDAEKSYLFAQAMLDRSIREQDEALLLGFNQPTSAKNDPNLKINGYADIAKTATSVGLTPNVAEGNAKELISIAQEIKRYFTYATPTDMRIASSRQKNIELIVSEDIKDATYETFNSGSNMLLTFEELVRKILPDCKIISTNILVNTMYALDSSYCHNVQGKFLMFDIINVSHYVKSLLGTYTMGSVLCKDPAKVIVYKDFITATTGAMKNVTNSASTNNIKQATNVDIQKMLKEFEEMKAWKKDKQAEEAKMLKS